MPPHTSLTGAWSGAYRYPRDSYPETVFEATIEESGGAFSGSTLEPNILRPWLGAGPVTALIEGTRTGSDLNFVKFMDGSGGMDHAIRYSGAVNADFTRIEGAWSIAGDWSGTFFMERSDLGAEEAVAQAVMVTP